MSSKATQGVRGLAIYKKKDGTLSITKDHTLLWVPLQPRDAASSMSFEIIHITNLQQTPPTAPKASLRVFVKPPEAAEAVAHMFTFNSPTNPRGEADAIKDALSNLITATKASDPSVPKANGSNPVSAAMAMASAVRSGAGSDGMYDDAHLKNDIELQQSLMKKDSELQRTYMESRRTKPDTISDSQFNSQFWSTRTDVLRAHAADLNQKRGSYNVLSAVKPRQVDGELKMNISAEQVQLIFSQHPLVKRVYDENVPKLNEMDFWSRFFLSRLFKKLKGERITQQDSTDPTFDRYLNGSNGTEIEDRLKDLNIPHVIDLEGNEDNTGGVKSGNRQDYTMIPGMESRRLEVPIVKTLNSLSEKIMAHVAPSDVDPANPIGMDEATFKSLALRDLEADETENRIMLNIKEQSNFFSNDDKSVTSAEAQLYLKQVPSEVLFELVSDLDPTSVGVDATGGLDLRTVIGVLEDSDSEEEEHEKTAHVGSKASFRDAQKQVMQGIKVRRAEIDGSASQVGLSGLSQKLFDRLTLTHATTTEFLHHFWLLFLSGDADRAGELAKMVETLDRAMDRINAVASDAEKEREAVIESKRQQIRIHFEKTGKKVKWDPVSVKGGEKVVRAMMAPTIRTVQKASAEYRKALAAEGLDTS